jgi:hypothetical protein
MALDLLDLLRFHASNSVQTLLSSKGGTMFKLIMTVVLCWVSFLTMAATPAPPVGPEKAKGDTPVRFIVCAGLPQNCTVFARFKTIEHCEIHKQIYLMQCDRQTTPGQIVCREDKAASISTTYCSF